MNRSRGNGRENGEECQCALEEFPCQKCSTSSEFEQQVTAVPGTHGFVGIAENDEFGRHLVALKDIPMGAVLWKEKPLVTAPLVQEMLIEQGIVACSGCYSLSHLSILEKCSKCHWPVCNRQCEEMLDHKLNECARKARFSVKDGISAFSIYCYRTALLKTQDPGKWKDILEMNSQLNKDLDPALDHFKKFQLGAEVHYFKIGKLVSLEEYETIFHILKLNSLGYSTYYEDQHQRRLGVGLYKKVSLMTNSCIPNCSLQIQLPPSHELTVHAATDINKGERLTRFYYERMIRPEYYLGGSAVRQRALQLEGFNYLTCKCALCSDATEMGTNMSTLFCPRCKDYTLLPVNPGAQAFTSLDDWEWNCTTTGCPTVTKNPDLTKLHEDILTLSTKAPRNEREFKECSGRWLTLKKDFKDKVHPNYWPIVAAASELCRQYCQVYAPPLASPDWKHHEEIMVYLLKIYDVIRPGLSFERARLQHSIGKAWFVESCGVKLKNPSHGDMPGAVARLAEILEMEKKALEYYQISSNSETSKEIRKFIHQVEETKEKLSLRMAMMGMSIG